MVDPWTSWLLARSMETLHVRVERQVESSEILYCIRSTNGEYLLRLLDFYDEFGATGTFTFECIKR